MRDKHNVRMVSEAIQTQKKQLLFVVLPLFIVSEVIVPLSDMQVNTHYNAVSITLDTVGKGKG